MRGLVLSLFVPCLRLLYYMIYVRLGVFSLLSMRCRGLIFAYVIICAFDTWLPLMTPFVSYVYVTLLISVVIVCDCLCC